MKKIIAALLISALIASAAAGCSGAAARGVPSGKTEKLSVICSIFPEYDWTRSILGDNPGGVELTLLLQNGVDLHSYQPSTDDVIRISTCDMFIHIGGESEGWVNEVLAGAENKDMTVISLLGLLGDSVKEEELIDGMEGHDHDHEDEHDHESEPHSEAPEYDEHVWLSLKNAETFCSHIAEKLCEADPENADTYRANAGAYIAQLSELDGEYQAAVDGAKRDTLLFGDRFPFRYLTDDYGLSYYAAFVGCSAETEASFETIAFLAKKADELGLASILTIDGSEHRIAQTIIENTASKDLRILTLDSIQSVTSEDIGSGETYLSIMRGNLDVLREALN